MIIGLKIFTCFMRFYSFVRFSITSYTNNDKLIIIIVCTLYTQYILYINVTAEESHAL